MSGRIPLRPSRVIQDLGPGERFARDFRVLGIVTSTNDLLLEWARRGAMDGCALAAEGQTGGRGRRGRSWASPPNRGLYLSALLRPLPPDPVRALVPIAAGLAVCEALDELGIETQLKWPNDVLVGRKKVAGILVDTTTEDDREPIGVVGFGVNDHLRSEDLPTGGTVSATSLRLCRTEPVDREKLTASLLRHLRRELDRLESEGPMAAKHRFLRRDALRGADLRVAVGETTISGSCLEICPIEGLLLATSAGPKRIRAAHAQILSVDWKDPDLNAANERR